MINGMPGMGGQQLPQGVTPEMLANPQFLAMLRAQMGGGGVAHPAMGGGGGMQMGAIQRQQSAMGGNPLAAFMQRYNNPQQPQMTSKGISNPAGEDRGGLLGNMFAQQGGAKAPIDSSYGPQQPPQDQQQQPQQQQMQQPEPIQQQGGLLGSFGGGGGGGWGYM